MNQVERNMSLVGKSGTEYHGKMYEGKGGTTALSGLTIVCLGNTRWVENYWQHTIHAIYNDDALHAYNHFKERDDVSRLILIPYDSAELKCIDVIDDLRRQYIHK